MSRTLISLAIVLQLTAAAAPAMAADSPPVGLAKEQPATGRFVKTEAGYMVPYRQAIPGTDVTFEMQPIPGGKFLLGSPPGEKGRKPEEGPQVEVQVEPFWMSAGE